MAKLTCLVFGYELWASIAKDALKKLDDILTITEDVTEKIMKYFDPTWDEKKSLPLASFNGFFGTMIIVQSDDHQVDAHAIKDLFRLTPQAATNPRVFPQCNIMLQLPGKIDKESDVRRYPRVLRGVS